MPLVSIITPAHDAELFIDRCISSVINQSFQDWEMIVVNDASVDATDALVRKYTKLDSRVRLISLATNSGAAVARNAAISEAKGRYIAFLDCDDAWEPCKLKSQLAFMQANRAALVFSAYKKVDEAGSVTGVVGVPTKAGYSDLLKTNYIGCLTAMYDSQRVGKVAMPLIRKRQDLALWLKIIKMSAEPALGQPEVLASYTVREGSVSSNKQQAAAYQWRVYREVEKLSPVACVYYFTQYALRGVMRAKIPRLAKLIGILH